MLFQLLILGRNGFLRKAGHLNCVWGYFLDSEMEQRVSDQNEELLNQVNTDSRWFHAKKTRPIWVIQVDTPQTVNTLEGPEQVAAGTYLCRGEAGDIWPQSEDSLLKRYVRTDEWSEDGWQKCAPHPDAQGVMAIQMERPFQVRVSWGLLSGKAGDFLLKKFEDRDKTVPEDLWIVDQILFCSTYERQALP